MHWEKRKSAVEVDHVTYAMDPQAAPLLQDITFSVLPGEWVAIVGANGSGKSTLIRLIAGLLAVSSGAVRIHDVEVTPSTIASIRRSIGIVFQNPDNQFIGMTVADDIVFGLENRCLGREEMETRLERAAAQFQLDELLDRHPSTLSGGQKQRVAIASVLALEPDIVLFDEATSMLDEQSRRNMIDTMKQLRKSGNHTLISVTHDHDEMLAADRLIAIADRQLIANGPPRQVLQQDEVLKRCRIRSPFSLQVSRALQKKGLDIGKAVTDTELEEALWAYISKR